MISTSPHAQENIVKYARAGLLGKAELAAMGKLIKSNSEKIAKSNSAAVVVRLEKPVNNSYREQWEKSDLLVAIIRGQKIVTVMFSRTSQNNKGHYRTNAIIQ